MDKERFAKQLAFMLEADKEKEIYRQTHITGYKRQENDAEHAWHMAMMIYLLKEYANEPFDLAKTMMMALIHDVVEIDAGDTYAYDDSAKASQAEREEKAAHRIFGMLPDDQREEMLALFHEFEARKTPEAKFAHSIDNFQPLILNEYNGGKDWRAHNVTKSKVINRQTKTRYGSKELWEYTKGIIDRYVENGNIINDD